MKKDTNNYRANSYSISIEVINRQNLVTINRRRIQQLALFFAIRAGRRSKDSTRKEISIVVGNHALIRAVHSAHLGSTSTTDVICLPFAALPGEKGTPGAEIFVNVECAIETAIRLDAILSRKHRRWNASQELALYIAHGLDHLAGGTDDAVDDRNRMRRRELRWIEMAKTLGLMTPLFNEK